MLRDIAHSKRTTQSILFHSTHVRHLILRSYFVSFFATILHYILDTCRSQYHVHICLTLCSLYTSSSHGHSYLIICSFCTSVCKLTSSHAIYASHDIPNTASVRPPPPPHITHTFYLIARPHPPFTLHEDIHLILRSSSTFTPRSASTSSHLTPQPGLHSTSAISHQITLHNIALCITICTLSISLQALTSAKS